MLPRCRASGDRPAPLRRTISPAQADFWNALLERTTVRAIVTLNYDLTIEQTVGMVPNLVAGSPGFHYAGIDAKVRPVRSPYGTGPQRRPYASWRHPSCEASRIAELKLGRQGRRRFRRRPTSIP
jgi:hypothetical protein